MQDLLLLPTGVKRALKKTRPSTTTRTGSYDDDNNIDWVPDDIIDEGGNMAWWHKLLISLAAGILISACISLSVSSAMPNAQEQSRQKKSMRRKAKIQVRCATQQSSQCLKGKFKLC